LDNGVYVVTLKVDDDRGGLATDSTTVTVNNLPPVAVAGPDQTGAIGDTVSFDGNGSSDPGAADTLSFVWDFGDGTPVVSGEQATHSYNAAGNYTVTLTVTDDDGATAIDTVNVTIE
jgi:PKD repeat protein